MVTQSHIAPFLGLLPLCRSTDENQIFASVNAMALAKKYAFQGAHTNEIAWIEHGHHTYPSFQLLQKFTALSEKSDSSSNVFWSSTTRPSACRSNSLL